MPISRRRQPHGQSGAQRRVGKLRLIHRRRGAAGTGVAALSGRARDRRATDRAQDQPPARHRAVPPRGRSPPTCRASSPSVCAQGDGDDSGAAAPAAPDAARIGPAARWRAGIPRGPRVRAGFRPLASSWRPAGYSASWSSTAEDGYSSPAADGGCSSSPAAGGSAEGPPRRPGRARRSLPGEPAPARPSPPRAGRRCRCRPGARELAFYLAHVLHRAQRARRRRAPRRPPPHRPPRPIRTRARASR